MRYLAILLLLLSAAHATNVNAQYWMTSGMSDYHFNTDMQFTTDFTLSVVSGSVASGNPANLASGDTVCQGATVRVTPTVNAKWATSSLDIDSIYPTCLSYGYCPAMISYSTINYNRNIKWLSGSTWDTYDGYGADPTSQVISHYTGLGTFHDQSVTYITSSGGAYTTNNDKRAGANIFCKGDLQVRDGTTTVGAPLELPTTGTRDITLSSTGTRTIGTRLTGVECFGAVVKHPLDTTSNTEYFRLYYFTKHDPTIPTPMATDSLSINVQAGGGTCSFGETEISASTSFTDADYVLVRTRMQNYGDEITITGVSSSNTAFTVDKFPPGVCLGLGFPSSLCPSSHGFDTPISSGTGPGTSRDLYVLIDRNGATGGTILTYTASTTSATCGGAGTCTDTVDLTGAIFCDVDPATMSTWPDVVDRYTVECQDLGGDPISCSGSNWYWSGLTGGFIEKTSSQAIAYTRSSAGSTGRLYYQSGAALCYSDVTVQGGTPPYECELIPSSATMDPSASRYFRLNCFRSGTASTPDDAEYGRTGGLGGSTSNESTSGATYNAPSSPTEGDMWGYGYWNIPGDDPHLGGIGFAHIRVISGGNTTGNMTGGGGGDDDGSSEWCTVGDGRLTLYPGFYGWTGIMCGPDANETCSGVVWSGEGANILSPTNNHGTWYNVTGSIGTSGKINAYVDSDPGRSCYLPFTVGERDCLDYS